MMKTSYHVQKRTSILLLMALLMAVVSAGAVTAQSAQSLGVLGTDDDTLYIIETDHFQVIFPGYRYALALETADDLERMADEYSEAFQGELKLIWPVFLTDDRGVSNAFVSIPPHRAEFDHIPGSFAMGADDWYTLLVLHEGRHIFQYETAMRGITAVLMALSGERGVVPPLIFTYPDWLIEGDAVLAETIYGIGGRGVRGDFLPRLRSVLMEREVSYADLVHGSYQHDMPNAYEFGLLMTLALREFTSEVSQQPSAALFGEISRLPIPLIGDGRATLHMTGLKPDEFFTWVVRESREYWSSVDAERTWSPFTQIYPLDPDTRVSVLSGTIEENGFSDPHKAVTGILEYTREEGYRYRVFPSTSGGVAVRPHVVSFPPGFDHFSTPDGVAWFSISSIDPFQDATKRVLRAYSRSTGRFTTWEGPNDSSIVAADFRSDGSVIAITYTRDGIYQIVMSESLRSNRMTIIGEYSGPGAPREIVWRLDDQVVITEDVHEQTQVISWRVTPEGLINQELLASSECGEAWISDITPGNRGIAYLSDRSGVQEVWYRDLTSGNDRQMTSTRYGVMEILTLGESLNGEGGTHDTDASDNTLWYIERVSSQQRALRSLRIGPALSHPYEQLILDRTRYLPFELTLSDALRTPTESSVSFVADRESMISGDYLVRPYRPITDGLRMTGYGLMPPSYAGGIEVGVEFADVLGRIDASLRGGYIQRSKDIYLLADMRLDGNILDMEITGEYHTFLQSGASLASVGLTLYPTLRWTAGAWDGRLVPALTGAVNSFGTLVRGSLSGVTGIRAPALSLSGYTPAVSLDLVLQSQLHVAPAYVGLIDNYLAFGVDAGVILPGFGPTHSIALDAGSHIIITGSGAPFVLDLVPRGTTTVPDPGEVEMLVGFKSTYLIPLGYPDLDLLGVGYLHQIDAGLFTDSAYYRYDPGTGGEEGWAITAGFDIACEFDLFRSSAGLRIGGEFAWDLTAGSAVPIFTLSLTPIL